MITETYKGRKIKVVKGRDWGHSRVLLNGVDRGSFAETQQAALASIKGAIDHADRVGVSSGRYPAEFYAPGTYELCEHGHAMPVGGPCAHSSCRQ